MWVLVNHEIDPLVVPPSELHYILLVIKNICLHPQLAFQMIQMIISGLIILLCKCHLSCYYISLLSSHLSPLLTNHCKWTCIKFITCQPFLWAKFKFSYILEGEYLAISMSQTYVTMPTSDEIYICFASWHHLCVLNTALYPVDKIEWYKYAFNIRNHDQVREHYLVNSCICNANLALNIDGYIWAIRFLSSDRTEIKSIA